ncbi:digestive organ expansion factor homolog [Diaphorina citri]|uniref:Digestive organ expansion factor homolog n=1 Tax=Diaphorina citri TaxID=121845 RepID=A0A3Q0J631_DIACI|nr:digestive organ expansion factor homolog [Diaphorina citri]
MVRHKNRILKKKLKEKNIFSQSKKHKFIKRKKKDPNDKYNKKKKKQEELSINSYQSNPHKRKKRKEPDNVTVKVQKKNVVNVIKKRYEESSSGEEEDEQSYMYNTLLGTFNKNLYSKSAVSSESEESQEDDEEENNNDTVEEEEDEDGEPVDDADLSSIGEESENENLDNTEEGDDVFATDEDIDDISDSAIEEPNDNDDLLDEGSGDEQSEEENLEESEDGMEDDDEDDEEQNENEDNAEDPFVSHLKYDLSLELLNSISNKIYEKQQAQWPTLGQMVIQIPKVEQAEKESSKTLLSQNETYACPHGMPTIRELDYEKCFIKSQLHNNVSRALVKHCHVETFTPLQTELFSVINSYQDLFYPERTFNNAEEIRFLYCLHAVNHSLKTRLKVIHHNARLTDRFDIPDEFRDQGLVRPKVLIVAPFKDSALRIVRMITSILLSDECKANVINKKRFYDEFSGEDGTLPRKNPHPTDFEKTFVGKNEETDITLVLENKYQANSMDGKKSKYVFEHPECWKDETRMNALFAPFRDREVNPIFYDVKMKFWKDLIQEACSNVGYFTIQELNTAFTRNRRIPYCTANIVKDLIINYINLPSHSPTQVFHRVYCTSPLDAVEERFNTFVTKILPQYKPEIMNHTLIYVPSYFDFIRLRNYMKREDMSFVQICEYSKDNQIARARDLFFHAEKHFLLYSERFHFFRRIRVRGIRHIVFYEPPQFPHFYSELINFMQVNENGLGT